MVSGQAAPRTARPGRGHPSRRGPRRAAARLCWLCTAPFGNPVVPPVYAIAAGRVRIDLDGGGVAGCRLTEQRRPLAGAVLGVDGDEPAAAEVAAAASVISGSASVTLGSASPSRYAFSGGANARLMPSQMAPRRMAPRHATTMSGWFGSVAATRSPGPTPRPASAAAASGRGVVELAVRVAPRSGRRAPRHPDAPAAPARGREQPRTTARPPPPS